ncbi:hypothetical protein ASPZODRAFT_136631 [Penicilliopsis zonata CBS 506.65]|uniref:tRNA (uracil-O(2)-)-methyltransferase n=1 Tax=Penicilliopsis zonata CBS 506.65 TaxID=1073090 RepID=A0A1L9S7E6_9EURO|nr:hypothetical protein ASPZODRAFT_136631 [Penicilliopsis zonata CBS 506.65]OJJ43086.1 hypothetical protein ASPZODRAFT_136631 [Penicilliopsis zonata CBS 506.65]
MPRGKNVRDLARLSGRPLAETLERSSVTIKSEEWLTASDLHEPGLQFTPEAIHGMEMYLLANPNMNSSHLFRADILLDSWGVLKTPREKEQQFAGNAISNRAGDETETETDPVEPLPVKEIPGFKHQRTIVRRLIPRNINLDKPLDQTCHFYESGGTPRKQMLVMYRPHVEQKEDLPWYHPVIRAWASLYDYTYPSEEDGPGCGTMSVHFLPYASEPISTRLERILSALLNAQIRLARLTPPSPSSSHPPDETGNSNPIKDNIIPKHLVQNTYARLKCTYATELLEKWVEETEPEKHVFEDLLITAFLIELWRNMYGVAPSSEEEGEEEGQMRLENSFPGFVDIACGNGVLVYVLSQEGYSGRGFDARRRKTWDIFPDQIQARLQEAVYIPPPFVEAVRKAGNDELLRDLEQHVEIHPGVFPRNTFIISNHADELTVWTPLMAALSCPDSPSPFLSIPCCSHSLSGARYRYPPPKLTKKQHHLEENEPIDDGSHGDLKALRARKQLERTDAGMHSSMYGTLTAKTMAVALEAGQDVEKTILRIPSTRNLGVVGGRKRVIQQYNHRQAGVSSNQEIHQPAAGRRVDLLRPIEEIVRRECAREGGVLAAALIWIERVKKLHVGQGKGNQPGSS